MGCSTVRGGGRLTVPTRLCLWHSGGACLPPRSRTSDELCLQRSRLQATTDGRASLRAAPRCEAEADSNVRARLCLRHSDGDCLPPRPRTSVIVMCKEAAMELRLMVEQDCGLLRSARWRRTLKCVLVSAPGTRMASLGIVSCTRMKSACHSDHAPAMCVVVKKLACMAPTDGAFVRAA